MESSFLLSPLQVDAVHGDFIDYYNFHKKIVCNIIKKSSYLQYFFPLKRKNNFSHLLQPPEPRIKQATREVEEAELSGNSRYCHLPYWKFPAHRFIIKKTWFLETFKVMDNHRDHRERKRGSQSQFSMSLCPLCVLCG
jgi:hypothetical protein